MAARILYECSVNQYDRVIVIWTGINRLDMPIPRKLHETYPGVLEGDPAYSFCTPLKQTVWYHSGGNGASWAHDKTCPTEVKQFFKTQYLGATSEYRSDMSLSSIAVTQSFLESQNIPYQMSFIYDITRNYAEVEHRIENVLGEVSTNSIYYKLVNWDKIKLQHTAYEWALQNQAEFENDQFHPTRDAMREWINFSFGIDIAA